MEEIVLGEKKYKMFKFIRGWLMALFVIITIVLLLLLVLLAFTSAFEVTLMSGQATSSFWAIIGGALTSTTLGALLFYKGKNRKNFVSAIMLVNVAFFSGLMIVDISTGNLPGITGTEYISDINMPSDIFWGASRAIIYILKIVYQAIDLLFAILLFLKTRRALKRMFPFKWLFILYVVIVYVYPYTLIALAYTPDWAGYMGILIAFSILIGFLVFITLFPVITLYKALDDDVFYEHFIVENPAVAIDRYDKVHFGSVAIPKAETRYCINCGSPLQPGAAFCGKCGHKVGEKPSKIEE